MPRVQGMYCMATELWTSTPTMPAALDNVISAPLAGALLGAVGHDLLSIIVRVHNGDHKSCHGTLRPHASASTGDVLPRGNVYREPS